LEKRLFDGLNVDKRQGLKKKIGKAYKKKQKTTSFLMV
jgi:hypothetical protein